jgi:hypothetical protein
MTMIKKQFTFDQFISETQVALTSNHSAKYQRASSTGSEDFTGTKSFNQATGYLKHGWPEGVSRLKTALDNIKSATAPALECSFDVAGEEVDVGRLMAGDPENMVNWNYVDREGIKFTDVYVSYGFSARYTVEQVVGRGAAILANIDGLEANGHRCRIIGYQCSGYGRGQKVTGLEIQVILKDYNENLELDRLAFCLVNPSMLRRMGFKLEERFQPKMTNHSYGHGQGFKAPEGALHVDDRTFTESEVNRQFSKYAKN